MNAITVVKTTKMCAERVQRAVELNALRNQYSTVVTLSDNFV